MILRNGEGRFALVGPSGHFTVRVIEAQVESQSITRLESQADACRHCVVVTEVGASAWAGVTQERQLISVAVEVLQIGVLIAVADGSSRREGL